MESPEEKKAREQKELADKVAKAKEKSEPKSVESLKDMLARLNAKHPGTGIEEEEPAAAAPPSVLPKKKRSKKIPGAKHTDFPNRYPKVFRPYAVWPVFDWFWRMARKTGKGKLRFVGYLTVCAEELKIPYITVKRAKARLVKAGFVKQIRVGKNFHGKFRDKAGRDFDQTILMIAWCPSDIEHQKIEQRKAAAKKLLKSSPSKTHSKKDHTRVVPDRRPAYPDSKSPSAPESKPARRPRPGGISPAWRAWLASFRKAHS